MLSILLSLKGRPDRQKRLAELYQTYGSQMLYLARSILRHPEEAEDAVQDAFVQASRYMDVLEKLEDPQDQRNYLLKITQNASYKRLKKHSQESCVDELPDSYEGCSDGQFLDQLCLHWEYQTLLEGLKQLEQPYREVLYYRFGMELTPAEIADLLERKLPTVKKQIARGKQKLLAWAQANQIK